jgi:hypothetical protein
VQPNLIDVAHELALTQLCFGAGRSQLCEGGKDRDEVFGVDIRGRSFGSHKTQFLSLQDGLGSTLNTKLAVDGVDMPLDGGIRDHQRISDLPIG